MGTYKDTGQSNTRAPYGKCPECGWEGRDWGFRYHSACKQCLRQWGGEQTKKPETNEIKEQRTPDSSRNMVDITGEISVTEHVERRLRRRAEREIPCISYVAARVIPVVAVLGSMYLIDVGKSKLDRDPVMFGIMLCGFVVALLGYVSFQSLWEGKVDAKTVELAKSRKEKLEEARLFYGSAEWRLLRQETITEQGRRCRWCGRHIARDFDLTVDHIKPRSKFPELALDKSNLQVLCRQCNSSKRDTILEGLPEISGISEVVKDGC